MSMAFSPLTVDEYLCFMATLEPYSNFSHLFKQVTTLYFYSSWNISRTQAFYKFLQILQ